MNIYLAFDMDYPEDYDALPKIFDVIQKTPVTIFVVGSRHPKEPYKFPSSVEIGNHSFEHEEWYDIPFEKRIDDMKKNHQFIKKLYNKDCVVYRSPHLRNFADMREAMVKLGYKPEMSCVECPYCVPFSETLKRYFSSHHHFGPNACGAEFTDVFRVLCERREDFTFFLDPHHFTTDERLEKLKQLITIGNDFGKFRLLSQH